MNFRLENQQSGTSGGRLAAMLVVTNTYCWVVECLSQINAVPQSKMAQSIDFTLSMVIKATHCNTCSSKARVYLVGRGI